MVKIRETKDTKNGINIHWGFLSVCALCMLLFVLIF